MRTIAKIAYGPLTFQAELPAEEIPEAPGKRFVSAQHMRALEVAAALWIIDHGAVFPEAIRALRAGAGLTASELADLLDIDKAQVSRWENGKHDPGVGMWNVVADLALDVIAPQRKPAMRARLEAAKAYAAKPVTGEIRLGVG